MKASLVDIYFKPSDIDPCLYIGNGMIILTYLDDCIIVCPSMDRTYSFVKSTKTGKKNFVLTYEGDISNYLGVSIKKNSNGTFELSQLHFY